jgi:cellulose synthase/poly-beta-1,6-N-acetylglucosamine synthase-like glycosyltransferase
LNAFALGFLTFVSVVTATYALVAFSFVVGLWSLKRPRGVRRPDTDLPFVSVVVAARNESRHVDTCLSSLLEQDYPLTRYEVVFVDDHSNDGTLERANRYATMSGRLRVLSLADAGDERATGKQMALDYGIARSNGEIIASTDADCVVPRTWLRSLIERFDERTGIVVGFSALDAPGDGERLFVKVQSLELLGLFSAFAGALRWNLAVACTGNNLAYRRAAYQEFGGFTKMGFTVAEDNMFLQWMNRNTSWRIAVALGRDVTVTTRPMRTLGAFLRQRLRWASNSLEVRFGAIWFAVVAYGANWLMPTALLFGLLGWVSLPWGASLLLLKALPEALLVRRGLTLFERRDLWRYATLVGPFHTFYVLIVGIAGLSGRVVWKERRHITQRKSDAEL